MVTVYHTEDKVNVCLADEKVVDALLIHYTSYSGCADPIDPEDTEAIEELRTEVTSNCPDISEIATAVNVKLGIQEEVDEDDGSGTAETKSTESKVSECEIQFEDLLTEDNDIFKIKDIRN